MASLTSPGLIRLAAATLLLFLVLTPVPGWGADQGPAPQQSDASAADMLPSMAEEGPAPLPARRGGPAEALPPLSPMAPPASIVDEPKLPPAPAQLSNAPKFSLRDIIVEGNTVLDPKAIDAVIAPYRGKLVTVGDLDEVRRQLTKLYIEAGFINSGVIIPNQNVTNGLVKMQAVEGKVTGVSVTGTHWFNPDYFQARLAQSLNTPFNVRDAEGEQEILLQDPLVSRLNIGLTPGAVPGEAQMNADVTEGPQYSVGMQIADDQSPTVGEVRGLLQGSIANLYGTDDLLTAHYGRTDGQNEGSIAYSIPVATDDTRVSITYDRNGTLVVAPSLAPLNVTSEYSSVSLGISRPFYRTASENLTLGVSLDWRRAQSFLLGMPFPFTAGADPNGHTNVTALRFTQNWLDRDADHAFGLRSTFSVGLHLLDSTVQPTVPGIAQASSQFFSWFGQAQYVRRVFDDWQVVLRTDLQLTNSPLFPIEQFALGGIDTVRGYREYLTVTDDALFGSAELRIPITRLKLPYLSQGDDSGTLQFTPFYDYGRGWNVASPTPDPKDISSVGAGFRWLIGSGTTAEFYYGYALRHVPIGNSLQDRGIHFRLTTAVF